VTLNAVSVTVVICVFIAGWFARLGWDILADWWFDASGGWLKDVFALIGVVAVAVIGWKVAT
jgi:hypothetical protein